MSFLDPDRLWLLALPVALAVAYIAAQARRSTYAVRFANIALLDRVAPDRPGWRRHVSAIGLLLALVAITLSIAGPFRTAQVPEEVSTVILAIDVSVSMGAEDVEPNRLEAAQSAALSFIEQAPDEMRIGLVAFSGSVSTTLPPTTDKSAVGAAIARFTLAEGTAIGEAISVALELAPVGGGDSDGRAPAAIVVLTDGETTVGRSELEVAASAALRGIPVSAVSFGTPGGFIEFLGETVPVPVNEGALREVADLTGGQFFEADSVDELQSVLDGIGIEIGFTEERQDLSDLFATAGLGLAGLSALAALLWFARLP